MATKKTYTEVQQIFAKQGYNLVSDSYENIHKNLFYICPNNHEHYVTLKNFMFGDRCPHCRKQKHRIKFYQKIKQEFEKVNYVLLSKIYSLKFC